MRLDILHRLSVVKREAIRRFRDEVNVVAHDHPREEQQALLLLAVLQALNDDVLVVTPREDIYPGHCGEGDEVQAVRFMKLVGAGHASRT